MVSKRNSIKAELNNALLNEKANWLWSYNKGKLPNQLPDKIIVEKYLLLGDKKDWAKLKIAFDSRFIRNIWLNNMVPSGMYEKKQCEIARYFFAIKNPVPYLNKAREDHLQNIIAGNY
jgi:hypothetical protein